MAQNVKTVLLLGGLTGLLLVIGELVGGRSGVTIALFLAFAMNFIAYFFSDKIVLAMYGAREVSPSDAPKLHSMVDFLAARAGIPKPKVYIIPNPAPNAFATGRSPKHAAVAVTEGLIKLLDEEEVKGVLGHEIAHVKNRDTLISVVAATIAGAITYIAYMMRWMAIFGGRDSEDRGGFLGLILLSVLAPIAALIIQMAISRSREYLADDTGAHLCGNPSALAEALRKIARGAVRVPLQANPATSHLFIVNPLSARGMVNLFSTHPPVEKRIERLLRMAGMLR